MHDSIDWSCSSRSIHPDGAVKATNGFVNYDVPAGVDPTTFRATVIDCQPCSVTFATATLQSARPTGVAVNVGEDGDGAGRERGAAVMLVGALSRAADRDLLRRSQGGS